MIGKRKREGSERRNDRKLAQEIQHILEVVQTTWDHAACVIVTCDKVSEVGEYFRI